MDKILVIDDAIPKEQMDRIENLVTSTNFPWHYQRNSSYTNESWNKLNITDEFVKNSVDTPVLTHVLWNNKSNSNFVNDFLPILHAIPNIPDYKIVRLQINLTFPSPHCNENTHSYPHIDCPNFDLDFLTGIYYINDSVGDTFIFNEKWGHFGELSIKQRISPRRGRLVLFNGRNLHAGNNPLEGDVGRLVANINLIKNEDLAKIGGVVQATV